MPTVLITGANRGLGLEFVKQYAADGWSVVACCRHPDKADALKAVGGDVRVYALDVTSDAEVNMLAAHLGDDAIDLLINNAGIYGPKPCTLDDIDMAAWDQVMRINVYAVMRVTRALLGNVAKAGGTIATLSSKMGSMADNTSGGSYIYRSTKAALNAVMKSLAHDVSSQGVAVVLLHPGWVRTDMGGASGLIDAPESITGLRAVIADTTVATTGRFYDYTGKELPW